MYLFFDVSLVYKAPEISSQVQNLQRTAQQTLDVLAHVLVPHAVQFGDRVSSREIPAQSFDSSVELTYGFRCR